MTTSTLGTHAIVIGGSMAGVLTARALSDHFTKVTLIERDTFTNDAVPRKGVPQARHAHGLLVRGNEVMARFFPNLRQRLADSGALRADMGELLAMYHFGGYKAPTVSGLVGTVCTRPLLDLCIRQELAAYPTIALRTETSVEGLIANADNSRVLGVQLKGKAAESPLEELTADLVVDTSGRGSQSPKWLEMMGYERPEESTVKVNVAYATRMYKRTIPDAQSPVYLIFSTPPQKRLAAIFPVEGGRWIATLGGMLGDHPPLDEEGFRAFARSLPTSEASDIIENEEPLSEIVQYRFPSNFRRHYEKLTRFPHGYLVLGDAICSFNPIYGQGMTTGALEANTLYDMLAHPSVSLDGFALKFFRAITEHVNFAWDLATGEDFRHAEIEGKRPLGTGFLHKYVAQVHRASQVDPAVHVAFLKVMNMLEPPARLMHPAIMGRVLRYTLLGGKSAQSSVNRHKLSFPQLSKA
jgi:2-polyprenyl-6-methoxyphenol hydroxylase-like FAD-dependent oxidoreductase